MKHRYAAASAAALAFATLVAAPLTAAAAPMTSTTGPLTSIDISPDLTCNVNYLGDSYPSFYNGTACGTFLAVDGVLYKPASVPASGLNGINWTPLSQAVTGSGTAADPLKTVTKVQAGPVELTQTDSYIVGQNAYKSSVVVTNTTSAAISAVVYRAADCYLQDNDRGYGEHETTTGAVACRAVAADGTHQTNTRVEQFIPLVSGNDFYYGTYEDVWAMVNAKLPLTDRLSSPEAVQDNAMALSWTLAIPAGASSTVGVLTNFSPLGISPLPSSIAAGPTVHAGQDQTVSARIDNPNIAAQHLAGATVTLPANVSYVTGSATGIGEPTISGSSLTFPAAASDIPMGGSVSWTFQVTAAAATSGSMSLAGTTVGGAPVLDSSTTLTFDAPPVIPVLPSTLVSAASSGTIGEPVNFTATVRNGTADAHTITESRVTLPQGMEYVPGTSTNGVGEPTVANGVLTFTHSAAISAGGSWSFSFGVTSPSVMNGTLRFAATAAGATVGSSSAAVTFVAPTIVPTPSPTPTPTRAPSPTPSASVPAAASNLASTGSDVAALAVPAGLVVLAGIGLIGLAIVRRRSAASRR